MIQCDREVVDHVPVSSAMTVTHVDGLATVIFKGRHTTYLDKNTIDGYILKVGDVVRLHDIWVTNLIGQSEKRGRFWKLLRSGNE